MAKFQFRHHVSCQAKTNNEKRKFQESFTKHKVQVSLFRDKMAENQPIP